MKTSVKEAAKKMGVTEQFIRLGLQQQRFPFGEAVKFEGRWSYYINAKKFEMYMNILFF
jgi:hypothetical protein